jgi:hypothetical protein
MPKFAPNNPYFIIMVCMVIIVVGITTIAGRLMRDECFRGRNSLPRSCGLPSDSWETQEEHDTASGSFGRSSTTPAATHNERLRNYE